MISSNSFIKPNVLLFLTFLTTIYWGATLFLDIYKYAIIGAVFELLWIPMGLMIIALPVLFIIYFIKIKKQKIPH